MKLREPPPPPPRDLLRSQLEGRVRAASGLVARVARWLSRDTRARERLDEELERLRFGHLHELERLRTLLDKGSLGVVAQALALDPTTARSTVLLDESPPRS
jgi:hypothetical protein